MDIDDVLERAMRCIKSHKDERLRNSIVVENCPMYWKWFVKHVNADLAVHHLSYENLHAVVCSLLLCMKPGMCKKNQKQFRDALEACHITQNMDDSERELLRIAKQWLLEARFADYVLQGRFSIELFLHKLAFRMHTESGW